VTTPKPIRVTVWHEHRHEHTSQAVAKLYPDGMHAAISSAIEEHLGADVKITTATLDQDENHGLSDDLIAGTDVMTWWGHCAHREVRDEIAQKVAQRVREGMGLIVLHSGHYAKPFKLLMGTGCHVKWREAAEIERLWCVCPGNPITAGLTSDCIELEHTEMYGEHFDIPQPDEQVFISWFEGGEVFRSGNVWRRGAGRVFYFRPGHETFPIYHNPEIRRVIANAVRYLAPVPGAAPYRKGSPNIKHPLSPIAAEHQVDQSLHEH
jgi:trehalose utilization protein